MKTTNTTLGLAALTVAMIAANAAMAEDGNVGDEVPLLPSSPSDASGGWLNGDDLTGDWGGKRAELAANGFDFFAYYNAIVASNVGGGIQQGTALAGDLYMGMTVDLGKAAGLDGWTFNLSGIDRAGASIDEDVGGI